jgi:glycine hydroxymethyltransferase
MVPFDTQSPFVTSGIRIGTPAVTTRGFTENDMSWVVNMIDEVITNHENEDKLISIKKDIEEKVKDKPLFVETETV